MVSEAANQHSDGRTDNTHDTDYAQLIDMLACIQRYKGKLTGSTTDYKKIHATTGKIVINILYVQGSQLSYISYLFEACPTFF